LARLGIFFARSALDIPACDAPAGELRRQRVTIDAEFFGGVARDRGRVDGWRLRGALFQRHADIALDNSARAPAARERPPVDLRFQGKPSGARADGRGRAVCLTVYFPVPA
jgi:hypothetical protein